MSHTQFPVPGNVPGVAHPADGTRSPVREGLVATGLVHRYTRRAEETPALAGVDLTVSPGESMSIMGPSGSGKTTLLHVLAGVIRPTHGSVLWQGRDLARMRDAERSRLRRTDFGFVFQSGQLLPELPAEENAALPLLLAGVDRGTAVARVRPILERLGLAGMVHRRPGELSGGQAQRVAIARALAGSPGVVFADEPTGALDSTTGAAVMAQLVAASRAHGAALVVVTHDAGVAHACARQVTMRDGLITHDSITGHRAEAIR